ncbi:ABC transporter permease subunit, partial [Clostridioides difficile]|uniref:ABC transporter permease subunit n=1 Tax=Clostridioides difficile TaxID=1496 RepID=UPI003F8D0E72
RGTPLLLQMIVIFYGLPLLGIVFDRFTAGVVAFFLNYAAYFAASSKEDSNKKNNAH